MAARRPGHGAVLLDRRATLADVARRAGVSVSTASRALNGRGELSATTRAAVLEAAAVLEFRPSTLARSLRTQRTQTVGFVVPDISSPEYAAMLRGAQEVLQRSGHHVMLMNTERSVSGEVEALRTLLNHQVDGLLVATTGLSAAEFARVVGRAVPCVFFDGVLKTVGTGTVGVANEAGIGMLVDHLVEHGHRRIALLAGLQLETTGSERLRGFRAAVRRHGLRLPPSYVRQCDWTRESGRRATLQLLELRERPTAVVGASDDLALGCLEACGEQGVAIPDELALVSFDDPYFGGLLEPSLTALGSRSRDVGEQAAELLVAALRGEAPRERHFALPLELVRRRSCGCQGD